MITEAATVSLSRLHMARNAKEGFCARHVDARDHEGSPDAGKLLLLDPVVYDT